MLLEQFEIPAIVDDEDILAWMHRISEINGMDYRSFISAFFPEMLLLWKDQYYHIRNYVRIYNRYKGLGFPEPENMLFRHTDIPATGLFSPPYHPGMLADMVLNGADTDPFADMYLHRPFMYCPKCAGEDIKKYGSVIAHVPHQIHGVTACYKHGVKLSKDAGAKPVNASDPQVRTARMMHMLYKAGAVGSIRDIEGPLRERASEKKHKVPFSYTSPADTVSMELAASLFTDEEISQIYKKSDGWLSKCGEMIKESLTDPHDLTYQFPFIRYTCGKCGAENMTYVYTVLTGGICPACAWKMPWQDKMTRRLRHCMDHEYEAVDFPDEQHVEIRHKTCGGISNRELQYVLRRGQIRCERCVQEEHVSHIGEEKLMNCGIPAVITRFGTVVDIDLRFEDGRVCRGAAYAAFLKGEIIPEGFYEERHIGETRTMRNGLDGTITAYKDKNHITVRLSNGDEAVVTYKAFRDGYVKSETLEKLRKDSHIGERYKQNCGIWATIIEYENANSVKVRFDNGEVREKVRYHKLKHGNVLPPSMQKGNHSDRRQK